MPALGSAAPVHRFSFRRDHRDAASTQAALVVEISHTSLALDRTRKASIYALINFPRGLRLRGWLAESAWMEHVDRPADLQALAEPAGAGRPWVDVEPLRGVVRSKPLHRIGGCRSRLRHLGQEPAVRSPEPERAVGLPIDLKALLVDCSVVPATE